MPTPVKADDVQRMKDALFIEPWVRTTSASRFWVLLSLATIIATSGLIADSTATVIGAMIVAPLMTPILGIALAVVLGHRSGLLRSIVFVVGGALLVILLAYLISRFNFHPDDYAANTQVSARISPRLIDLLAALATGTVGAFALVRRDISDTLPGVAIAISLVPPLAVVGVLLQVGRVQDAMQALLLFGTNVAAIIVTGTVVLALYRVRMIAIESGHVAEGIGKGTIAVIASLLVVVMVPLAIGPINVAYDQYVQRTAEPIATEWAESVGWEVAGVQVVNREIVVTALGPPPEIKADGLRVALNDAGLGINDLVVRLVDGGTRVCPAKGSTCSTPTG
jgi:uncharacterized hydrophobic protein (TIGR00271 family)